MNGYPKSFYSWLLAALSALLITGLLLIPTTLEMRLEQTMTWHLPEEYKTLNVFLHGLTAFIALWLLGAIWSIHIRSGWRRRKNHISGLSLCGMFAILLLTGLGIYYIGDEQQANWSALIHLGAGVLAPLFASYHFLAGRRI